MNFFRKLQIKTSIALFEIITFFKIILLSIFHINKVYLFGIPIHGNLGDQAILVAEREFLKENFKNYKIIEIESKVVVRSLKILKKIIGNSTILMHGGGFLGSLWTNEEEMFRKTLKIYNNNPIIVLPQTVFFSNDEKGKDILIESKEIYSSHKNLYICCREKYTFEFMKENMPLCNVVLVPDMVLYLKPIEYNISKKNVLFCIRNDKEKLQHNYEDVREILKQHASCEIDYTDTVMEDKRIYTKISSQTYLKKKIKQFAKYNLVITDRLHGMIFALLAKTPCLVFENKSYKIKGVYDWIKQVDYIKLYSKEEGKKQIEELLSKRDLAYNREEIIEKYDKLIQLINSHII